jgi:hypothetical protein
MKSVNSYLIDLVAKIRMDQDPIFVFEQLDQLGVTFRAQNEVCNLAETTQLSGNEIVNYILEQPYLYRYPAGTKTEYIPGIGLVSEELKTVLGV